MDVFAPQEAPEDGAFVYGFDDLGAAQFRRPRYEDLDFGPVFGAYSTSATGNVISYGEKQFVLDADDGSLSVNDTVQIRVQGELDEEGNERIDLWMSGVVVVKDASGDLTVITVAVDKLYAEGDETIYYGWLVSRIARQISGLPASAALGFCSESFEIPQPGDLVAVTTSQYKVFRPNAVVLFKPAGTELFWVGIVRAYDAESGGLQVVALFYSPEADLGSPVVAYDQWFITAIDLNVEDADLVATSTTEVALEFGVSKIFTVQAGKAFPVGGTVIISDVENGNKGIWTIESYIGTQLQVSLSIGVVVTTGIGDSWIVRLLDGPPALPEIMDLGSITDDAAFGANNYRFIYELAGTFVDYGLITETPADTFLDYEDLS